MCYLEIASAIDWSRAQENLDKELAAINKNSKNGRRFVDKLIKVWLLDGKELWLLFHLEVQGRSEEDFCKRMYVYHYRLFDKYSIPIISMAILTDNKYSWRPNCYQYANWGCSLDFKFLSIKLLDFANKQDELTQSQNPFAMVILAQLQFLQSKRNLRSRFAAKLKLTKILYKKGWDKVQVINLYRFIDSIMALPDPLELEYKQEIANFEKEKHMAYLCPSEQLSKREGMQQGMLEGERFSLLCVVQQKFGSIPAVFSELIQKADSYTLIECLKVAVNAESIDQVLAVAHQHQ